MCNPRATDCTLDLDLLSTVEPAPVGGDGSGSPRMVEGDATGRSAGECVSGAGAQEHTILREERVTTCEVAFTALVAATRRIGRDAGNNE